MSGVKLSFGSYEELFAGAAEAAKELAAKEQAFAEKQSAAAPEGNITDLLTQAAGLSAEAKVQVLLAMGFTPVGDDHDADCAQPHARGITCNCVPPATSWSQPNDVDVLRKETWDDRVALAKKWESEGSHGRRP